MKEALHFVNQLVNLINEPLKIPLSGYNRTKKMSEELVNAPDEADPLINDLDAVCKKYLKEQGVENNED